jgi:hypothetical protein
MGNAVAMYTHMREVEQREMIECRELCDKSEATCITAMYLTSLYTSEVSI